MPVESGFKIITYPNKRQCM